MAAAELKLQVGLDLAFFRQQLAQLGTAAVGYQMPINIKFDRLSIQQELNKLGANISRRTYRLEVATNIATEIKNAGTLAKALRGLDNAIQKNKGVANRTGGGATGSVVDASKLEKSLKTATKPVLESVYNEMDRLGIRMAKAANDAGKTTNESLRAAILSGIPQVTADMAQGLAKGINPLMQINGQKGAKLFIDAWKDAAGIASPSKVFKEIGKNIIDGLEIGLQDFDALKTKMIGEMREFAAAMKREAKVGGIGIGGLLSPIARPQGAATKTIPGVLSPMGGVSSDPGRGNQKILNSLSLLTGDPALYRKRMSSVGPERLPSSLLGAAQSQFSLESLAPSFKQARLASKVSPLDKIIDEAFFGRGTLPKAQSALSSLSNSLERLGTATRAAMPSGILRDASGNARLKAFGGVDPSQTMGIFPPMGKTPTSAPGGSFLQFSQRATAVSAGLQQPSAPFPMGGGGAPPIPPTPPRGGQGGAGGFGGRLNSALAGASLPGAGLVKEIGSEFGYAAKQVLLFGAAYRGLAFLTDFPAQVGNAVASLQTYRNTLTAVTGGGAEFSKSNQFVLDLVEKYNIPLQSARDGFTKLYASMAPAGFKGDEIRNIFTGISQGAATFGMSADKVDRVNYAFAQMASKGQVMSEELKGQLGDVLPGA
ncbi:Caudovirus, tape measure, N-terminal, partial [uncultured Caudovirales phage]